MKDVIEQTSCLTQSNTLHTFPVREMQLNRVADSAMQSFVIVFVRTTEPNLSIFPKGPFTNNVCTRGRGGVWLI